MILYSTVRSTLSHASDKGSRSVTHVFSKRVLDVFVLAGGLFFRDHTGTPLIKSTNMCELAVNIVSSHIYIYTQIKSNKSLPLRNIIYTLHDIT